MTRVHLVRRYARAVALTGACTGLLALFGCGGAPVNGPGGEDPDPGDSGSTASGSMIVFVSERDGNAELYRIAPDGSSLERLTQNSSEDGTPDCSPDGSSVVFHSERDGSVLDVYRMSASGENVARLTARQGSGENDASPTWGPDGDRIAFSTSDRAQFDGQNSRLALMDADGSNVRGVGDSLSSGFWMDWSSRGAGLALSADVPPEEDGVDLVRADTLGGTRVLHEDTTVSTVHPDWSPAADELAYTRARADGSSADIYSMSADGSNRAAVVAHDSLDAFPAYGPDGSRIAFASNRSGNFEIYVADADGGNVDRVTEDSAPDYLPTWCRISG